MTSEGGAEALKAAIRRSLLLIVVLLVLGVVTVNVLKQLRGPTYTSSARVLISTTPLSQIITGTLPSFVDPNRVLDTAQALASSPEVYKLAARRTHGALGTAGDLSAATSVSSSGSNDILTFSAKSSDASRAVAIANAASNAYIQWRADLASRNISATADELRAKLRALGPRDPGRKDIENLLTKLDGLQAPADATVVATASSAAKISPAPVKDSILGASIGLVIALLVVALREAIDTTVRSENDVEDLLSAPVLATVRKLPRGARMVTYGRHESAFADAYGLLAAHLAQRKHASDHVVLAVTSAVSGEGKTTTAANLAVSLARRGTRVLLADFDFRKPALSELFDLPRETEGVFQVLSGTSKLDDVLLSVTLDGTRPGVSRNGAHPLPKIGDITTGKDTRNGALLVLASGGTTRAPSGSMSHHLGPLVKELRSRAEFVILDTPPALLTVEVADLARIIDNVLVVVRQGRVSQRSLRSLGRQARSWPADLAGAVLTGAPGDDEQYMYYGNA